MNPVILIVVLATLGEVIIEALKPALEPIVARLPFPDDVDAYMYLSLILGLLLAFGLDVSILEVIGVQTPTQLAAVLSVVATGLIIGRGANFVHDALERLRPSS